MHTITKVEYLNSFKLILTFNDKKRKIVDLKKYANEGPDTVFYPFRDLDFFMSVKVDKHTGTIVWPNGVDLCPDVLYKTGKKYVKPIQPKTNKNLKKPLTKKHTESTSSKPKTAIAAKSKN